MDSSNLTASISLRPGGAAASNPFSAFSQGAGVKSQPQKGVLAPSATPHTALLEERKKELGLDMIKYSAKFMLHFAERYTRGACGLQSVKGLIVDDVTKNQVTQKTLQSDNDNWRSSNPTSSSTTAPTGAANSSSNANNTTSANSASTSDRPAAAAAPTGPALGMLRAEDVGRQKWQPAKGLESSVQAQQKLRGILNKLTPDNFDRLLTQVLGIMSVSTEVLRKCIPLLFEKAVAEPKFCALYADLSAILSKELASHDFGKSSEGKAISFKRELLNTCQAGRKLKLRQLGTLRLLAELFNRDLLTPAIMKIVTAELLQRSRVGGVYDSELIECVVQAIAISGQKMSNTEKLAKPLKSWLATLSQWSDDMSLEARIRFKIKDLQDQIAAGWYSKMDANTVKKTEEIRKQAETELGIVSTTPALPDFLPGLNIGPAFPAAAAKRDPSALFPEVSGAAGNAYGMPVPTGLQPLPDVRPDQPDSAKDTSGPSVAVGSTPDADVRKKAHGTFQEFLSIRDFTEAETCIRELALSVAQQGLVVSTALNDSYDVQQEAERTSIRSVVVHLADTGLLVSEGIQAGFKEHMEMLDDLAVDIPLAPPILGKFLAALLEQGSMPTTALEGFFEVSEMAEPKRGVFKHLMKSLEASLGQSPAAEMLTKGDVKLGPFLDADKTLEPNLPSVFDFAKMENLEWVPL